MKQLFVLLILFFVTNSAIAQVVEEAPPPPQYTQTYTSGIHPFKEGGLKGLKDYDTGEVLLEAKYDYLKSDNPGYFQLRENSKWGIFSEAERKVVIPVENAFVMPFKYQLPSGEKCVYFEIIKSYKYPSKGILDNKYNVVVPAEYDQVDYFPNFLRLRLGGNWGIHFYDDSKANIPVVYDHVLVADNDNFMTRKGEVFGLFDKNGVKLFEEQSLVTDFSGRWEEKSKNYLLISNKEAKMGIFHLDQNEMLLPQVYDLVLDRFNDLYIVKKNGAWGVVDQNNKTVIPFKYEALSFLKPMNQANAEGERNTNHDLQTLISAKNKGKYGLIDRKGKVVSKIEFDEVEHLYGFYAVKKNGKYSVLNDSGEPICNETFDRVGHFHNGKAAVFSDGKKFYLNSDGSLTATISKIKAPKGFKEIDEMYEAFVQALKSEDDAQLREFCEAVAPDAYSLEYMNRVNLRYRGIPDKMNEGGYTVEMLASSFFERFVLLRDRLKKKENLSSLEFVSYQYPMNGVGYQKLGETLFVLAIENAGILNAGGYDIEYKMGELLNIDGYWKSFTMPRTF